MPLDHDRSAHARLPAQERAVETVVFRAAPDVFNHNLETVPSKYLTVRPGARYFASIRCCKQVKELDARCHQSGIMLGLGEERTKSSR